MPKNDQLGTLDEAPVEPCLKSIATAAMGDNHQEDDRSCLPQLCHRPEKLEEMVPSYAWRELRPYSYAIQTSTMMHDMMRLRLATEPPNRDSKMGA